MALLILIVIGVVSYRSTTGLVEAIHWRKHTYEVLATLGRILSQLRDAETGQRGYIITGDGNYLEPYFSATQDVAREDEALRKLTAGSPHHQRRLNAVGPLITEKLAELRQTIDLRRHQGFDAALQVTRTDRGRRVMDEIRKVLQEIEGEEQAQLDRRDERIRVDAQRTLYVIIFGSLLAFASVTLALIVINRHIVRREQAEAALRQSAGEIKDLYNELEVRVRERTADLVKANEQLQTEAHERRRTEEALRESQGRFQAFMDNGPAVGFMKDTEGRFIYVNKPFERCFNVALADLQGKTDFDWLPVETATQIQRNDRAVLQEDKTLEVLEAVPTPDGVLHYWLFFKFPVKDASGKRYLGGVAIDVTGRKQAEEQLKAYADKLEQNNRELQDFAYVASHDLQEPLRKIQTFGDRLRAKCGAELSDQGRDYLERMQNAAGRMQTLISDLLSFSRITTQAQPFVPVDFAEVARAVLSDLEARIEQTGGRVELGELPTLEADALQVRQLLQNLIGNALKFHQRGEPPVVKVYGRPLNGHPGQGAGPPPNEGQYQLMVEDNGIGFDERYLDRIFTPFQRLHNRSAYEGTGIGLAICRKIAERHGGSITAKSTPGQGATFIVTLPAAQFKGGNIP